ncbi:hypothetical protein [Paraflavitalea sp. CAU 1676]|uniref:hypothetical protein n=1 Tax=Paraflavitalea sp. CAU 1676 TaxID=3032598 RepID=UPI0023DABDE8|nr:hypothetical protein [Paraflavitalea sp. CAU 1676]MDF2187892.1 hypothetical protein [Paraflavitalea sp. CAU 1676]
MKSMAKQRLLQAGIFFSIILVIMAAQGCAKKVNFQTSQIAPAATGEVKIKKEQNANYKVEVSIRHLAPPDKLATSRKFYIVWAELSDANTRNLGIIKSSSRFLSSTLKGSLTAVVPSKPKKVFITAETESTVTQPGFPIVLTTNNF